MTDTRFDINTEENTTNGVIGADSDVREGVGPVHWLIDIDGFLRGDSGRRPSRDSAEWSELVDNTTHERERGHVCKMCGYDRAELHGHTEIRGQVINCANCDYPLLDST